MHEMRYTYDKHTGSGSMNTDAQILYTRKVPADENYTRKIIFSKLGILLVANCTKFVSIFIYSIFRFY